MKRTLSVLFACLLPLAAQAQWNAEWPHKRTIVLDTSAQGAALRSAVNQVVVPVRLHSGNFDFPSARPDGADLRFVAADDKTELAYRIESFDPVNELAVVWVAVPQLLPNLAGQTMSLYFGNAGAAAPGTASVFDERTAFVLQGGSDAGQPVDAGPHGVAVSAQGVAVEPDGIAGSALRFDGKATLAIGGPSARIAPEGLSLSLWQRSGSAAQTASLVRITGDGSGANTIELALVAGVPVLRTSGAFGAAEAKAAAPVTAGRWQQLAVVLGDRAILYVDGQEAAQAPAKAAPMNAQFTLGTGYAGDLDEVRVVHGARSPDWVRAAFAAEGPDARLVRVEEPAQEAGGEVNYLAILVAALPLDAIVVIALLGVMALAAAWVMISRALDVTRATRANADFIERFRAGDDVFADDSMAGTAEAGRYAGSTLYPVFVAAREAFRHRRNGDPQYRLENRSLVAIRSLVDASVLRQSVRLNRFMVLLTIAISGGPFLGLLGTVVGVMITFAAIAAVGDVNINAIAPGIAAALLATVAGLAVAIPALFGYNYLASRIKEVSNDTHMFGDEVVSRLAEQHGA